VTKPIKITNDLRFGFEDLMRTVDFSHPFTLRDVLRACVSSKMHIDVLCQMLRCNVVDFWVEAESKTFKDSKEIEYLEVYWFGEKNKKECSNVWDLHGIGYKGKIPKDVNTSQMSLEEKKQYREKYAVDLSPLYTLADYQIRMCPLMRFEDKKNEKWVETKIGFILNITLIELLYSIFWELSFFGSPEKREEEAAKIKKACKELKTI